MVVFQESINLYGTLERRLLLNGKTYVQLCYYSAEEKGFAFRDEDDLCRQLSRDYRHYPEDIENGIWDDSGLGLRYGYIINEVAFLEGGTSVDWNVKNLYDWSLNMVADGAVPATPVITILPLDDTLYRLSWHHDGSCDETVFFDGKEFSCHYGPAVGTYHKENRIGRSVFCQLANRYDFFKAEVAANCLDCRYWTANGRVCDWIYCFWNKLQQEECARQGGKT